MTERLIVDESTNRVLNWLFGIGSIVTGALLVWIGSQTFQLAQAQVETKTVVQGLKDDIGNIDDGLRRNTDKIGDLGMRVQAVEIAVKSRNNKDDDT